MGTQKRLVLVSVTSMMLVLAFMAGFVPSYDAAQTGASGSDGRVDMAGLLDMILGDKAAITGIVPASPVDGLTYVTPAVTTGSQIPYIPVDLTAAASPAGATGDLYYVVNPPTPAGFNTDAQGLPYWGGTADEYVGPVAVPPFSESFDLGPKVPQTAGLTQYAINALAAIKKVYTDTYNGFPICIYYGVKNSAADTVQVNLRTVAATADADGNGLADDIFGVTALGTWVAEVDLAATGNPEIRDVVERDLAASAKSVKAADTVIITPRPGVTVEVPSEAALAAAGVVDGTGTVAVIVSVTDDMSGAIDGTQAVRQQWANAVLAGAPGALIPGAPIVQIAVVADVDGVPTPITNLNGLTAKVSITGLTDLAANTGTGVAVWGVHTATNGSVFSAISGNPADAWYIAAAVPTVDYAKGTLEAELSSFSAFVPLYSELRITDIDPKLVPNDIPVPITLTGIFPTAMAANTDAGLTAAEATATYKVYIGTGDPLVNGTLAAFRSVDTVYTASGGVQDHAGVAVTALHTNPLVPNKMYLTSPTIPLGKAASVNVSVQSVANPGNSFTLSGILQVSATGEVVVTTSGQGSGSVTLDPPHGSITLSDGTVVDFPANRYLRGTAVTATALPLGASKLTAWSLNGTVSGNGNAFDFTVSTNPTNLNAQFDLTVTTFMLNIVAPANGTIDLSPPQPVGGYPAGQTVTLTAIAAPGYQFNLWNGSNAGSLRPSRLVSPVSLVMNSTKTIGAEFLPVATTKRLTLTAKTGGTIAANPPGINGGTLYNTNTAVTLTAQPSSNFLFDRWTGASAASLADVTNPVQHIVLAEDMELTANFRQVLNITAILPDNAWIFGGIVAKVSGTGLGVGTKFTLGGRTVWGFNPAADGSSIEIVIPATDDRSDNPLVIKQLKAEQGGVVTPAVQFTYKRFSENTTTGMNTTAFILDNPGAENTIKLGTGGSDITSGKLILPGLNTDTSQLYGIVLDKKLTVGEVKSTTAPVTVGNLSSSLIDDTAAGTGIENAYDFSVFLYSAPAEKATMPPVQSSIYVDASAILAATLGQGQDANGIPNAGTAMKVTLPLDGTGLTYSDVRKGLALWAIESQYDPAGNTESITDPKVEAYQSELLQDEVDPSLQSNPKDSAKPDQMLEARIYSLNGFSLRRGWTLPADVAAGVRLAKVDGNAVSGTGSGPVAGGTVLTLVSPKGGLGYVDRIVMRQPAKLGGTLGGIATQTLFVSTPGADEYTFEFKTPKSGKAGKVDIVVYLKSSPETPAAVLSQSFEYKAASFNIVPLLLLLLGILLALIGITAAAS